MKSKNILIITALVAVSLSPALRADDISSLFISTSNPTAWKVSTNVSGVDTGPNDASRFLTGSGDFIAAVSVTIPAVRDDYIANNPTGTNGWLGRYTQFVFRQTFDLTGYDPTSALLSFQWAADDSGESVLYRGSWLNRFSLNGGGFQGVDSGGYYVYDPIKVVQLSSGFASGLNTIDFYVQGNGVSDGFELKTLSFSAARTSSVPDSGLTLALLSGSLISLVALRRRFVA